MTKPRPLEQTVVVTNAKGLHVRAATTLANTAKRFASTVHLVRGGQRVDAKSIMGLLLLTAAKGTELTIACEGGDAREALAALVSLVERGFDE